MFIKPIKAGIRVLLNPKKEFESLNKKSLETLVWDYLVMLVAAGILAGIFNLIYSLLRALYLNIFMDVSINYLRMMNYSVGRSVSLLFLYLFAGTFLLFFASLVIRTFCRKIKYASLFKILFYSTTPLLMFGWFFANPFPLGIWSIFLFVVGIKTHKYVKISKDSIHMRE